jgi:hypothetical protein
LQKTVKLAENRKTCRKPQNLQKTAKLAENRKTCRKPQNLELKVKTYFEKTKRITIFENLIFNLL